jgi:C4-dicarboxylate-specific signal transduction histidine kinase
MSSHTSLSAEEDLLQRHVLKHELRHFIGTARLKLEELRNVVHPLNAEVFSEVTEIHHLIFQAEHLINTMGQPVRTPDVLEDTSNTLDTIQRILQEFETCHPHILWKHTFTTSALVLSPITVLHWRQLLYNIFNNAVESLAGIEKPMLYISFYFEQGFGVLEIHDNGPGFPAHLSPEQLVMPYVSMRPEEAPKKNGQEVDLLQLSPRGLGLYVCQRIMKSVNGDLRLGKSLWNGACLKLTFPAMEAFE